MFLYSTPHILNNFLLGVPLRVGLSAISLLAFVLSSLKKNEVHSPKSEVRASQRMPLQSLTQSELKTESGKLKVNFQFSTFHFQLPQYLCKNRIPSSGSSVHCSRYIFKRLLFGCCFSFLSALSLICRTLSLVKSRR